MKVNINKMARTNSVYPDTNYSTELSSAFGVGSNVYMGFDKSQITGNNLYKTIDEAYIHAYINNDRSNVAVYIHSLNEGFVESEITYNNSPEVYSVGSIRQTIGVVDYWRDLNILHGDSYDKINIPNALNNGVQINAPAGLNAKMWTTRAEEYDLAPYLIVTFGQDFAHRTIKNCAPSSGFISKHVINTFSWIAGEMNAACIAGDATVVSAKMTWKATEEGTVNEITASVSGNLCTATVAADVFSTDSIMWKASITDDRETTTESEWFTISTIESTSSANAVSPANTIVDGSAPVTFTWEHVIATGTPPTKSELQISANDTTWSSLKTVIGSALTTDIPANTIASGQWYWRVRTYNTDNVAGSWSESQSFIAVSAPIVQGVTATNTPRPTVNWQSADQRGFQVKIGDIVDSGVVYGAENSWKSSIYMADGEYTVQVRVQNAYGLWSSWATAFTTVTNTPGDEITAAYTPDEPAAVITWGTSYDYDEYILYRDNRAIARTTEGEYIDNLALGSHEYFVRGIYNDSDNYGLSDTLSVNIAVNNVWISAVDNPNWMPLYYSNIQTDETRYSLSGDSRTYHVNGAAYPVVETSRFKNKYLSGRCAFMSRDEANAFEALTGRVVVCKMPEGEMIVGALENVQKTRNEFFTGFTFSITHTALNEDVDI